MDARRKNGMWMAALFLCLALIVLIVLIGGAGPRLDANAIVCAPDRAPAFFEALPQIFPDYQVHIGDGQVLSYLENGAIAQAIDVQARAMRSRGLARYWYPQYVSTVVIAIDRDQTDAPIFGWSDLSRQPVAIGADLFDLKRIALAMAYGLDGEGYTVHSAVKLLKGLRNDGLLETKHFDAPVLICYDHQAAALIKAGRNLQVVIPREGTFSYQNGLLSNVEMALPADGEDRLIAAGLRLPDGRCDPALYPEAGAYMPAILVPDDAHFSMQHLQSDSPLRRQVLGVRLYSTADGVEHQLASSLFIAAVLFWAASVVKRAMQKRVQRGAVIAAVLLAGWILLRMIKWQIMLETALARYLWFTYIPFQIAIAFLLLWLAWGIDRPKERAGLPLWLRVTALIAVGLIAMVLTNDLHGFVYHYDLSKPGWLADYRSGIGYYIALGFFALQFFVALGMLVVRHVHSPRKIGILFPALLCVVSIAYGYGYVARIPLAYESDVVMMTAVLSVLFFEASIRSGLIPVNTKYAQFFAHSPLSIQIIDHEGGAALSSKIAAPLDEKTTAHVLSGGLQSVRVDADTLLFSRAIAGGFAVWHEDIGKLNRLHEQIRQSVDKRKRVNAVLARDAKIQQQIEEEKAQNLLMDGLDAEISEKMAQLQRRIAALSDAQDPKREAAMIALSLCYIKRRSDFFFGEQEASCIGVSDLIVCTEELGEYAALAGTHIRSVNQLGGRLPARLAAMLYGFFGEVLFHCAHRGYRRVLSRLCLEGGQYTLWMMLPDEGPYQMGNRLAQDVRAVGGTFAVKDLEDAIGVCLSIPADGGGRRCLNFLRGRKAHT